VSLTQLTWTMHNIRKVRGSNPKKNINVMNLYEFKSIKKCALKKVVLEFTLG